MKNVIKPISLPAGMRDFLARVQQAREEMDGAFDDPSMREFPRAPELRDKMHAVLDISIEQVREVYQRLEQAQDLERSLPAIAEKAGFDEASRPGSALNTLMRRHKRTMTRRMFFVGTVMLVPMALAGAGGVWLADYQARRGMVQVQVSSTCVNQPDGSQTCTWVIPPSPAQPPARQ